MKGSVEIQSGILKGRIATGCILKGTLVSSGKLRGKIVAVTGYDYYSGDYEVTPDARQEKELMTKDLVLSDNVVVHKIPYYETSNVYGETIYIGTEV